MEFKRFELEDVPLESEGRYTKEIAPPDEVDLHDEEVITKILEEHDAEGMKQLREKFDLTPEEVELYSQYAIQRKSTLIEMKNDIEKRKQERSEKTPEEEKLGVYVEALEPQVRDAVLKLSSKGYKTYESGFELGATQTIGFSEEYFKDPDAFRNLKEEFQKEGVTLQTKPDHIILRFDRFHSLDEIKEMWDKVTDALPKIN